MAVHEIVGIAGLLISGTVIIALMTNSATGSVAGQIFTGFGNLLTAMRGGAASAAA